jgi:hypothetical protein
MLGVITGFFTTSPAKLDVALASNIGKAIAMTICFFIFRVFFTFIGKATIVVDEVVSVVA